MATSHDCITPEQMALIRESPMFFVASAAPDMSRGQANQSPVNLSPKGGSPLHVIDEHRVAYVGATRCRSALYVVPERVSGWATTGYPYPI